MFSTRYAQFGLTILRVIAGIVFTFHGWQKIFQMGMGAMSDNFAKMGVPLAGIVGPGVSILEFVGGIALIIGLLTQPLAVLFVIDMLCAIALVHGKNGFSMQHMGYEFVLSLAAMSACLALAGPGAMSVDGLLRRKSMD